MTSVVDAEGVNNMGNLLALLFSIPLTIFSGWATSLMWTWFVVPQFHVTPLAVGYAIGLNQIVTFMTLQPSSLETKREPLEQLFIGTLYVMFALTVSFITHLCIS